MADDHGGIQESIDVKELEESSLRKLRKRWELASVLNFFSVFEPLIGKEVIMPAEEVENALITPNASLTKLHITLLKVGREFGLSINKKLSDPGGWVTSLCKKLTEWWPRVAEGEVPLTEAKGEEISRYKELDPTIRLLMLKALCEIRTMLSEQDDVISYVNDSLKQGAQVSLFVRIGLVKTEMGFLTVIGYRLYKEINNSMLKQKHKGNNCLDLQNTKLEWEILATNLDEFRKASEKLSSCQVGLEAAVHETVETEVIPVLEKTGKERDLKRRQKQEALLSGSHSYAGITRSCRTRRPAKYTFGTLWMFSVGTSLLLLCGTVADYLCPSKIKRKDRDVERNDRKNLKCGKRGGGASDGNSLNDVHFEEPQASSSEDDQNIQKGRGSNNNEENDQLIKGSEEQQCKGSEIDLHGEGSDKDKDNSCTDNAGKSDIEVVSDSYSTDFEPENVKADVINQVKLSRGKNNIASGLQMKKNSDWTSGENLHEARSPEAKNRYRQRPTRNSAIHSSVAPDPDDGSSSENFSGDASGESEPYQVADSEDDICR
ncbi:DDT domain-containing protein DDR4 [Bienertia sinuspersici]